MELLPPGNATTPMKSEFNIPAGILALGLVLAALVGSYTFYTVRSFDNVLSVTGSAKERVTSDSVKWNIHVTRHVTEFTVQTGYAQLARDLTTVKAFLADHDIPEDVITISPVAVEEIFKYGTDTSGPREFTLRQMITINATDVEAISALSKDITVLVNQGVFISANYVEYYYNKLSELRIALLADAIADAKARAQEIAESSGQSVGRLTAASSGVVQVLAPNSVEISDYGQYDTSSIEKDVMVTVRASFRVR